MQLLLQCVELAGQLLARFDQCGELHIVAEQLIAVEQLLAHGPQLLHRPGQFGEVVANLHRELELRREVLFHPRVRPERHFRRLRLAVHGQLDRIFRRRDQRALGRIAGIDLRLRDDLGSFSLQVPDDAMDHAGVDRNLALRRLQIGAVVIIVVIAFVFLLVLFFLLLARLRLIREILLFAGLGLGGQTAAGVQDHLLSHL